jgi:hypothetical protein
MSDWLQNNKTWVFSGVGIAVGIAIMVILSRLMRRKAATDRPSPPESRINEEANQQQFSWTHAVKDVRGGITRKFRNEGSEVSILLVQTNATVRVEWHPKGSLSPQERGWVRFTSNGNEIPLPITWKIDYRSATGQPESQAFSLTTVEGQPERLQ